MNFFGHAVLAERHEATRGPVRASFVLGAMLPDFASMLGVRPPSVTLGALIEGLRFHHLTDDAFHGSRSFMEFSGHALQFLRERGLARGGARAVAHVGVELLLDGALRSPAADEAYLSALRAGLSERVTADIAWQTSVSRNRFYQLCLSLSRREPPQGEVPGELIAQRLRTILAGRPRLALDDHGQSVVRDWAVSAAPVIRAGAQELLREVEQRLSVLANPAHDSSR